MKIAIYFLAVALGLLGLLFLVAAGQGNALPRIAIGLVCLLAAGAIVALSRLQPAQHTHISKVDLSGDVALEQLTCQQCGGSLGKDSVTLQAGAVFVNCEYCGAQYQLEEAPRW
ncbi:MAG: hypothetical protein H6822_17760 [Planctomycetaceae bacterium]|nr:hypothetical protein [Planctomycetales bacterium]MCB9924032.1 hypothetical protein [Planctomycetaceae bacterium]